MKTLFRALLIVATALLGAGPVLAQEANEGFDMSSFQQTTGTSATVADPLTGASGQFGPGIYPGTVTDVTNMNNTAYSQSVDWGGTMTSDPQYVPGTYTSQNGNGTQSLMRVLGNATRSTGTQNLGLPSASQSLVSEGSMIGNIAAPIPTGDSLGFPAGIPKIYHGVTGFQFGGILPPTSTAEVTLSVTNGW